MRVLLLFLLIASCRQERTCVCQTVVTDKVTGQRLLDGEQEIIYEGTKGDCDNVMVVDSYSQKIEIVCNAE